MKDRVSSEDEELSLTKTPFDTYFSIRTRICNILSYGDYLFGQLPEDFEAFLLDNTDEFNL